MSAFMIRLGTMSLQASVIVICIWCVRWLFARFGVAKKYTCLLWSIPYFAMVCPWKPTSIFGFWNAAKSGRGQLPQLGGVGLPVPDFDVAGSVLTESAVNYIENEQAGIEKAAGSVAAMTDVYFLLCLVWLAGVAAIVIYIIVSYMRLRSKLASSIPVTKNLYWAEDIQTPFVFGIIRPGIYFPINMREENIAYMLEHERTHLRRNDSVKKMAALLITSVHWFNPFAWAAYIFFGRDMEMACDEETISRIGEEKRSEYADILLKMTMREKNLFAAPPAFGEADTKSRIKNIVGKKKAWKIATAAALIVIVILAAGFLTENEKSDSIPKEHEKLENPAEEQKTPETSAKIGAKQLVTEWAEAFCSRDGEKIISLASEELEQDLKDRKMLTVGEEEIFFGQSSPWPWSVNTYSYTIRKIAYNYAEIAYYTFSEEAHVTVWVENITYDMMNELPEITEESLEVMEDIDTYEEFLKAYPGHPQGAVANTYMDYLMNGIGEALNAEAKADPQGYEALFAPETAVKELLNLADDLEYTIRTKAQNGVIVRITAAGEVIDIPMIQPYGKDGIWIVRGEQALYSDSFADAEMPEHRPGYREAVLHAYDEMNENNPEGEAKAQRALRELYDLTGTLIEECWWDIGAYSLYFGRTKEDIEHSRIFYSRSYSDGSEKVIQGISIASMRRVWYSPVDMHATAEFEMLTNEQKVVWFVTHCGSYNGKKVKKVIQPYDFEMGVWHVIMEDDTTYEVLFDVDANIAGDITGPYPDSNIQH